MVEPEPAASNAPAAEGSQRLSRDQIELGEMSVDERLTFVTKTSIGECLRPLTIDERLTRMARWARQRRGTAASNSHNESQPKSIAYRAHSANSVALSDCSVDELLVRQMQDALEATSAERHCSGQA